MKYFFYAFFSMIALALLSNAAFAGYRFDGGSATCLGGMNQLQACAVLIGGAQQDETLQTVGTYVYCRQKVGGVWSTAGLMSSCTCSIDPPVHITGLGPRASGQPGGTCGCPVGTTVNPSTGQCDTDPEEPPPPCEGNVNPYTGQCEECSSNIYNTHNIDPLATDYGICLPACDPAGMEIYNHGLQEGAGCVAPPEECNPSFGSSFEAATGGTFNYCDQLKQECDTAGGVYGAVGTDGQTKHVCIVNMDPPATCASGSQYWVENLDGSSGFACITADPPPEVCNAALYDCDNDGQVDDQDNDGCLDNGAANDPECVTAGPGEGSGGKDTLPGEDTTENVGEDELDPATEGAGDCDPTAANYAECIGQNVNITDTFDDELLAGADGEAQSGILDYGDALIDSLGDGTSGIAGSSGIGDDITDAFDTGSCSDLGFTFQGHTVEITCAGTQRLRTVLAWAFSLLTLFFLFNLAQRKPT